MGNGSGQQLFTVPSFFVMLFTIKIMIDDKSGNKSSELWNISFITKGRRVQRKNNYTRNLKILLIIIIIIKIVFDLTETSTSILLEDNTFKVNK